MSRAGRTISLTIPEHTAYLNVVRQAVGATASLMGFDSTTVVQLQMAVDEACTNVIEHGRATVPSLGRSPGPSPGIRVELTALPGKLVMHLHDRCGRFSPLEQQPADPDSYFRSPTHKGLGLAIIRGFVDDVRHRYRSGAGNVLTLTKYLPAGRPQRRPARARA